ncbi:nascent polypeptide-associated complex protein [Candidatus Woesearchaeota archaeon]|jgi:nascent polypeptide-associated complex subunit alpha|nr:nascent polypeptide-associated complex protein [Candidatus Woesearchaeota archaeon]
MFPGVNPRQMQKMMKKMGMQQQEIPATEVIIKTEEKEIIITNPSVSKVNMMGQETFQISGEIHERTLSTTPEISEEDIKTVMEQTGANEETVKETIEEAKGDLAEAIMKLKKEE